MKIIAREDFHTSELRIYPGDSLSLKWGKQTVLECKMTEKVTVTSAVIFAVEEGDFEGAEVGYGGAFLGKGT